MFGCTTVDLRTYQRKTIFPIIQILKALIEKPLIKNIAKLGVLRDIFFTLANFGFSARLEKVFSILFIFNFTTFAMDGHSVYIQVTKIYSQNKITKMLLNDIELDRI